LFTNKLLRKILLLFLSSIFILGGCKTQPARNLSSQKFRRIISLSPHMTELLYALGQEKRLVGVTDYCQYPPQAKEKEHIGGFLNPNLEKIIALRPDLLLGVPANAELARKLKAEHLPVVMLPNDQLKDIFFTIDSLGRLLNCQSRARQLQQSIHDSLNFYKQKVQALKLGTVKAMLVIGRDPGATTHLTVVGPHTFIDSVWAFVGGVNVFSDLPAKYAQVSRENILLKQPELIIEFKFNQPWNAARDSLNKLEWSTLKGIPAVQTGNIFVLTGNYTLIPGPRVYLLAKDFYHILRRVAAKYQTRDRQKQR